MHTDLIGVQNEKGKKKALSSERARLIDSRDIGLSLALKVFFPLSSDYRRAVQATLFSSYL